MQGRNIYVPVSFYIYMKKYLFLLSLGLVASLCMTAQSDTTTVKKKSDFSKNFGIGFGVSYSMLSLESTPYVLPSDSARTGESRTKNNVGANISMFYNVHLGKGLTLRPTIEANIMRAQIEYDTELNIKKYSDVFPVSVEIPITLIKSFAISAADAEGYQKAFQVQLGVRPVLAVNNFMGIYPAMKTANINIDGGIGMPIKTKKLKFRCEAIYSYGLLNLIGKNDQDHHTYSISKLGRSFMGLRFYFN